MHLTVPAPQEYQIDRSFSAFVNCFPDFVKCILITQVHHRTCMMTLYSNLTELKQIMMIHAVACNKVYAMVNFTQSSTCIITHEECGGHKVMWGAYEGCWGGGGAYERCGGHMEYTGGGGGGWHMFIEPSEHGILCSGILW